MPHCVIFVPTPSSMPGAHRCANTPPFCFTVVSMPHSIITVSVYAQQSSHLTEGCKLYFTVPMPHCVIVVPMPLLQHCANAIVSMPHCAITVPLCHCATASSLRHCVIIVPLCYCATASSLSQFIATKLPPQPQHHAAWSAALICALTRRLKRSRRL